MSLRGSRWAWIMLWQPTIVNRGLLQRSFICLVVQPPEPSCRDHGSVIVHTMLRIVDHPSVPASEVGGIVVVLVAILICPHMRPSLEVICPVKMVEGSFYSTVILDDCSELCHLVQPEERSHGESLKKCYQAV